jgi:glyoxylase-like metal-dependent hydrolase (beta-lactamase superfamily II)
MNNKSPLILKQIPLGPMDNFLYFLGDQTAGKVAVVDPAWDVGFLRKEAEKNRWKITAIFLTHGHPDHVNGLDELLSTHDIPAYISEHEASFYTPRCKNLHKVADHAKLKVGNIEFECLHTPGHTPGSQCFLTEGRLITGDTLFIDGCGRCDLPGGDARVMHRSLYNVILKLPEPTLLYPGHDYGPVPVATLKEQKQTNPYLQCKDLEEFLHERMAL